jgi:hypothetical protein
MQTSYIIEWTFFFLVLLAIAYTMVVIKEEMTSYKENALDFPFHQFLFKFPSWWGKTHQSPNKISFERTDTRYEWMATFEYLKAKDNLSTEEQMVELIKQKSILFDPDTSIIKNPSDFKEHPGVLSGRFEIVRVEGTATQDETDRIYLDSFLVKDLKDKSLLWATSLSSILNGLVEGPYFEEVMLSFEEKEKI